MFWSMKDYLPVNTGPPYDASPIYMYLQMIFVFLVLQIRLCQKWSSDFLSLKGLIGKVYLCW